jgi:phosphoribosylformylglycinamidine cyclo-ligase
VIADGGPSYRESGVDVELADRTVPRLHELAARTARPGLLAGIGGFGGLFDLSALAYRRPVLVSGTDGVGTKLKIAFATGRHDTVGQDCVAMCVNDILTHGAEPLFFLDYLALASYDPKTVLEVVKGVADGCALAGCALIGGETAQLPGFYQPGEYDLAGCAVGVVEKDAVLDGSRIRAGDAIVGLESSGLHSNGYSLVRRALLERRGLALDSRPSELGGPTLADELLRPTRIYVRPVLAALRAGLEVHGMSHITGGGLADNAFRPLPDGCRAVVETGTWPVPPVFRLLRAAGGIGAAEMLRTFNCGLGYLLYVPAGEAEAAVAFMARQGLGAHFVGRVEPGERGFEPLGELEALLR